MEWIADRAVLVQYLKKYSWAILVLAVGFLLMMIPDRKNSDQPLTAVLEDKKQEDNSLQEELEEILSQLEGAGSVRILLTESTGKQTHYQTDQDQSQTADSQSIRSETVILTDSDRRETGLVKRVDPPQFLGAIILCQGANDPSVRLAIIDAVGTATGLRSDKIAVWKMK